jgi:phage/plasmid-associated DNA primase
MSKTIQLATLNDDLTDALPISVFQLEKPPKSIFVGLECREFPDFPVIYGFIANKMGIKLRKKKLEKYGDEQTHYKKYLKQVKWLEELQYISVEYSHSKHGYARIQALNSLSLALFRRVSRHAFCKGKYIDCDLVNCHLQFFKEYAKLFGFTDEEMEGLIEYCRDPKYWRAEIVRHYELKDRTEDDGSITLAKDQAKELCIRLAFGGSLRAWKFENQVKRGQDLPIVAKLESSLQLIRDEIWNANPQMIQNLEENDEDFSAKSSEDKKKSLMAIWSQTKERLIQEECIAYLVKNFPSVQLRDVISSQDGMMVLAEQMKGIDIPLLFQRFKELIKRKFNIQMTWVVKEFDEALSVPRCSTMPIDITLDDLEKGEREIAGLIAPAFKTTFKFWNIKKEKCWYILNRNIWEVSSYPDEYRIIKVLQEYIEEEKMRIWKAWKDEKDEDRKKELGKKEAAVKKHYEKVGKGNYASQLIKYLGSLLKDNDFPEKLDNTKGLFVFKDCLLDLKTGEPRAIVPEDYITFVNDIEYLKLPPPNKKKMDFILSNLKKTFNNNQEHLEYGLSAIGYSLTGDAGLEKAIYCFKDGTDAEKGNNGKSLPFKLLKGIFPKIVDDTPYKVFEENFKNSHKFIRDWRPLRILYCDEGSKNKVNAELVKLVGAGEPIKNEIMFGYKETIIPQFKFFLCSNVLFNVGKDADAVFNRYKELAFNSHFDTEREEDNYETLEFRADKNLPDTMLAEYKDELIHLFIGYALKYYKNGGMPPLPAEFAKATALTKMKNNDFAVWFWNNFEIGEGNISIDTLLSCSTKITDRKTMFAELKKIEIKSDKDLTGFGKKKNEKGEDVYIKGGIVGFVKKESDE